MILRNARCNYEIQTLSPFWKPKAQSTVPAVDFILSPFTSFDNFDPIKVT